MSARKQELERIGGAFLKAFNDNDLDGVMSFFTDDIVYDELDGTRSQGLDAVRSAFEPQFAGRFGQMTFVEDDTYIDAEANKVMSSWDLRIKKEDGSTLVLRGLDLLVFRGDKICLKETYVKAKSALYQAEA